MFFSIALTIAVAILLAGFLAKAYKGMNTVTGGFKCGFAVLVCLIPSAIIGLFAHVLVASLVAGAATAVVVHLVVTSRP